MRIACLTVASLLSLPAVALSAITTVNSLWADNFILGTPLTNGEGTPLSNGGALDGDGTVIQIGYFDGVALSLDPADFGPTEWASFTPISGDGSANPHFATSMGDGTGGAFPDGFYSIGVTFDTAPAVGAPSVGLPTTSSRVGIRYFDATSIASSTAFNTVTSNAADWVMREPNNDAGVSAANAFLDARVPGSPTDPAPGLVWQDSANPFQTSIPEPSAALLGLLGLAILSRRRRV